MAWSRQRLTEAVLNLTARLEDLEGMEQLGEILGDKMNQTILNLGTTLGEQMTKAVEKIGEKQNALGDKLTEGIQNLGEKMSETLEKVIQRRRDGSVSFNRNWTEYEEGFGDLNGEFWLGLSNIYRMTSSDRYSLRVDLEDFDNNTAFALYDTFYIDGPDQNYRLHLANYSGTAAKYKFGWWFNYCYQASVNAPYKKPGSDLGIVWFTMHNDWTPCKKAEMKIKPRN
nr:hypothetical protein BaRGS_025223 [Batillaria attramentaria]